jgi:predicted helicase
MKIDELLNQFAEAALALRDKGTLFERLIASYLRTDPKYVDILEEVWLWSDWPYRWSNDVGIDLVARERGTGNYWAIQCKFYDPKSTIRKEDIDSFLAASGKIFTTEEGERNFSLRLIVSTTDKWSKNAEDVLEDQIIPVSRLWFRELASSPIDWSQFSLANVEDLRLRKKKELRPHQKEAIEAVIRGFQEHDRGKLIMACGTGKTFTALRLMEKMVPPQGRVLVLAPSISLVAQSLREWTAEANEPFHAFVVCSDTKVGRDSEDIRTRELAYPATTDPSKLVQAARSLSPDRRTVVFSTYQSSQVVADAQAQGFGEFDLIICDEAHRTTGLTLPDEDPSEFVKVHDNSILRAKKRLYMTATPRIFGEKSKSKAKEVGVVLYSMDDEEKYGPEFYRLGFSKAVALDLLSDYKVVIVAVDEDEMAQLANYYNSTYKLDEKKAIDVAFATKIIGSWKGLSKQGLGVVDPHGNIEAETQDTTPMRRAVAYSRSIKASKLITEVFGKIVELYRDSNGGAASGLVDAKLRHIDGTMNALQRQEALDWLRSEDYSDSNECRILSNARCLVEGVDVPALDAVIFFDARDSIIDIVQSVGRVMRKVPGKQYGYIILPVCLPLKHVHTYLTGLEQDEQFKAIWKVLRALRAHDETLVDEATIRRKVNVITDPTYKLSETDSQVAEVQLLLNLPVLPIDAIREAVYALIPKKLGDREYWSEWAKEVCKIAEHLIARIHALLEKDAGTAREFARFLKGLQDTLNPEVKAGEAIEMLAQHILTLPVFEALFGDSNFLQANPVVRALERMVAKLDEAAVRSETKGLRAFYESVRERISIAKSDKSKQDIIRSLYDTFFRTAFPRMAERLGIVYTPVEVVDFILRSADVALRRHFGESLSSRGVHILDPFAGTGTFLVRLIQLGLIDPAALPFKYEHEMHANEIVLLAYYIATVNIETAYHGVTGTYQPFNGMVLTDTFQMTERGDLVDQVILPENNERAERQLAQPIRVIVSNPPYSAWQQSENDNNKNLKYPTLDERIRETYVARSRVTNKNSLYDAYIRAIRWASDRIGERGVVAFVTNGSFIDANATSGLRKCLTEEYSHLYVFNLRGNQRTSGEESKREGGKIFGSGSRTPIAITIMVKDPAHRGRCELHYHDIGDYLSREEKLRIIENFGSIASIPWQRITPNEAGDWINQRDPLFDKLLPLGDKSGAAADSIFSIYSRGVATCRDAWVYNFSRVEVERNMRRMIDVYNAEVEKYRTKCEGLPKEKWPDVRDVVNFDPRRISWDSTLFPEVRRGRKGVFRPDKIIMSLYRPFTKEWLYFDRAFNAGVYLMFWLFPTPRHRNVVISVMGIGAAKPFSALVTSYLPDLELISKGQCFPLYWYDKPKQESSAQGEMFAADGGADEDGYIRRDAITDWALETFRAHYADPAITKEDIFWYVYGVLHSPEYRQRFAANLKKMLPRIPFATDFWAFSKVGRKLGEWHLNYESVEPYPLREEKKALELDPWNFYRVEKMRFGKKGSDVDKSVIIYNENLQLHGIPDESYRYVVNGKSAIEWVMERYQVTTDKDSGITNDPNKWCAEQGNPRYIVDLLKRVVRVSVETVRLVASLPKLDFEQSLADASPSRVG